MRAKPVNFERGKDPKQTMGIGGFDPMEVYRETYEKGYQDWKDFMEFFVGKNVSFVVAPDADNTPGAVPGERITLRIHSYGMHFQGPDHIWFFALHQSANRVEKYMIDTDEKIYIEK